MTRSELIQRLHATLNQNSKLNFELSDKDVTKSTKTLFNIIAKSIATGRRVEVRGFGGFSLSHQKPRSGRNPKTGESVSIPAKSVPYFKAGKELRYRVAQIVKK